MKRILVTGGAGFISSNMIRYLLDETAHEVVTMDALTYAGNLANLADVLEHERLRFIHGDIRDLADVTAALEGVDVIVNAAAESHVSKSIEQGGGEFVTTNVVGTQVLLDAMRERPIERFILISSSEVYGTAESDPMGEDHPLNPRSPYAGTKAGGDRLAYSYWCTYDLPITIIRPFNNYGPFQHPEKVIPRFIIQALTDQPLTIHGNGIASRDWLHVFDTAEAITAACEVPLDAIVGETINVATGIDESVEEIADAILDDPREARLAEAAHHRPARARSTGTSARPARRSSSSAGARASRSPTASSAPSAGTATIRTGGSRSWPRRRRPRPSCDRGPRRSSCSAAGRRSATPSTPRTRSACARSSATPTPRVGDVPVSSEDGDGVRARRRGRRRPDRPGHRLARADRRRGGRARPGPPPPDRPPTWPCVAPTRSPSGKRLDAAGVPQPALVDRRAAVVPVRRQGARPPGPAGDVDRRRPGRARSEAAERATAARAAGAALFEAFVPGPEVTVNGFTAEGRGVAAAVTDRVHFAEAPGVARRHVYPPERDPSGGRRPPMRAVAALGIEAGPCVRPGDPRPRRAAGRRGGGPARRRPRLRAREAHDGRRPGRARRCSAALGRPVAARPT